MGQKQDSKKVGYWRKRDEIRQEGKRGEGKGWKGMEGKVR